MDASMYACMSVCMHACMYAYACTAYSLNGSCDRRYQGDPWPHCPMTLQALSLWAYNPLLPHSEEGSDLIELTSRYNMYTLALA